MKSAFGSVTLAVALMFSLAFPALAGTTARVAVPPGSISVSINIIGQNSAGNITSQNSTSYCPAGNTVTVSLPSNTSSTTYSGTVVFQNPSGTVTGVTQIYNDDGGSGTGHVPSN
jgi:hypothetical protein